MPFALAAFIIAPDAFILSCSFYTSETPLNEHTTNPYISLMHTNLLVLKMKIIQHKLNVFHSYSVLESYF